MFKKARCVAMSLFGASATFPNVGLSLVVAGATFGDVGVSLFVAHQNIC